MKLSKRDKIGLGVLVSLFVLFMIALYFTLRTPAPAYPEPDQQYRSPENSLVVQQRMRNIEKGRN
jgi:hypothetical protein